MAADIEMRLQALERQQREIVDMFPVNALKLANEGHVHNVVIVEKSSGAPTHKASEGTLYEDTATKTLYMNDDGNTNWRTVGGGSAGNHSFDSSTHTDVTAITEAQGQVIYFDGTNWNALATGTDGKFLQTRGAGKNPAWANTPYIIYIPMGSYEPALANPV